MKDKQSWRLMKVTYRIAKIRALTNGMRAERAERDGIYTPKAPSPTLDDIEYLLDVVEVLANQDTSTRKESA